VFEFLGKVWPADVVLRDEILIEIILMMMLLVQLVVVRIIGIFNMEKYRLVPFHMGAHVIVNTRLFRFANHLFYVDVDDSNHRPMV